MRNRRGRSSTCWLPPGRLPRRPLPRPWMLARPIRKLRRRSPRWTGRRRSPKPRRPLPMKFAGRTRTAWSIYPPARQQMEFLRFLIELRCEKLRPRLLSLAEQVDDKAPPAAADPAPSVPSSVLPEKVVLAPPLPPPRMRATEHQKRTPTILASRGVQRKRHANASTAPNLPQLLLALFGEGSRNSTAARRSHAGGAGSSGGGN